ncbi:glycosyltransferase family 4 protein [Kocuria sp. LUK]|uniref:glycosyltransferase family 4 protein n=1 Tax=Kocuria sp. LUK TaxID=2897828 RepID=UPI001E61F5F9|nr:glycosyltransferase family 4 protein [Kocuria sp. LUK]MCD1144955.1 glycosyltransferase family 4 protein [Kocuria sp. LUK]
MEAVLQDLALNLASARKYELALLTTPGFDQSRMREYFSHTWQVRGARPGKYSIRWWMGAPNAKSEWAAWAPDVILSISSAAGSFRLHRFWNHSPIIAQCHGTAWHEVKSSLASLSPKEAVKIPINVTRIARERFAYGRFDHTIAISDGVREQLSRAPLSVPPSKLSIIPNYVDTNKWSFDRNARDQVREILNLSPSCKIALFAGRLHRQKGIDLAIQAMSTLPISQWHFIICGTGPQANELKRMASDYGLTDRVHFVGQINRENLPRYYSAADLLVFPTRRREGLPMNILEALASGLPVLTCKNANLPPDLADKVVYAQPTSASVAGAWLSIPPLPGRSSQLPDRYSLTAALGEYEELLDQISR